MKTNLFLLAICCFLGGGITAQTVSLRSPMTNQGGNSVFIGVNSGINISSPPVPGTALGNVFMGFESGKSSTIGNFNVFTGYLAGINNIGGSANVFLGSESGQLNEEGVGNIFIGRLSGQRNTHGVSNVSIGHLSGWTNKGSRNVYLGAFAGAASTGASTENSGNIFIGDHAGFDTNVSDQLIIHNSGSSITVPLIWGNFATRNLKFNVNSNATSYVEITGIPSKSGLRFTSLKSTTTEVLNNTTNKFLTVNATGDVVLENLTPGTAGTIAMANGANTTVSGNGSVATPYAIAAKNIYTDNGVLTGTRTMAMGDFNLSFNSASTTGGKVYIGQTSVFPTTSGNYRLYVEGGILTEKAKVALRSTANWADYVFANDYKLQPLSEVESFIKENKHLPGISSAAELVKEGLDLGSMQAKQMEKIEELTLYAIEQDKNLEAQKKALDKQSSEIEELKAQMKLLMEMCK